MAYYNHVTRPERATPNPSGGCLSASLFIPLTVVIASLFLTIGLGQIEVTPSAASIDSKQVADPLIFVSPYEAFTLTQGPHGFSYGHMAIDIAAGKGATIQSPINGSVSNLFVDGLGNPTLVIENQIYRVTMMHGIYHLKIGDMVYAGQPIGIESNLGNTTDMQGRSCRNRDCGYHTHLNVFDKRIATNVNPLDLLEP